MFKFIIPALLALVLITGCAAVEPTTSDTGNDTAAQTQDAPTKVTKKKHKKSKPSMTVAQKEAVESAESYLDSGQFSRKGLIEQLKFEEYSTSDAKFAVKHVKADYMAEAAESAESYMDSGSFSATSLVEQLEFEGFTAAQAAHGAETVGY